MVEQDMPAFPNTGNSVWSMPPSPGMTLRDWFAGQALTADLTAGLVNGTDNTMTDYAEDAYRMADAMLKAREQGK